MTGNDWVYPTEVDVGSTKVGVDVSGEYLGIPLSGDLDEIGFLSETMDRLALLSIETASFTDGEVPQISLKPTEESSRYSYKIRERPTRDPKYFIRIPPEWYEYDEQNPFYNLKKGDRVVVVFERGESPVIRVFKPEDYQVRLSDVSTGSPEIRLPSMALGFSLSQELGEKQGRLTIFCRDDDDWTIEGVSVTVEGLETDYEKTVNSETSFAHFDDFIFGQKARITAEELEGQRSCIEEKKVSRTCIWVHLD